MKSGIARKLILQTGNGIEATRLSPLAEALKVNTTITWLNLGGMKHSNDETITKNDN